MKSKGLIIGNILIAIIAIVIIAIILANRKSSFMKVDNKDDGTIAVVAQNAADKSSGLGYVTLEEGQKLNVRTNLTDNSTIKIEVLPSNIDATTKVLMEESFSAIDARSFELPSGNYTIRITAEKGTNGTMDIAAK